MSSKKPDKKETSKPKKDKTNPAWEADGIGKDVFKDRV